MGINKIRPMRFGVAAALLAAASTLAACGDSDDDDAEPADSEVPVDSTVEATVPAEPPGSETTEPAADTTTEPPEPAADVVVVDGVEFPKPELEKVSVGMSAIDPQSLAIQIVDREGIDELFGIDVEIQPFGNPTQVQQAVIAGQVDAIDGGTQSAFTTQGTASALVAAFVYGDKLGDTLVTREGVTSAEDLRGKSIAVSAIGSLSYAVAAVALDSLGLGVDDVTITPVGGDSDRLAALQAGSVDAAVQNDVSSDVLEEYGFNVLVDLREIDAVGGFASGFLVPAAFADENPNTTLALVAMYQLGLHYLVTEPEIAVATWAEWADIDLDRAQQEIEDYVGAGIRPLDGRCSPEVFEFMRTILTAADANLASTDPEAACTNLYVDQLAELGFQAAIGVEGY